MRRAGGDLAGREPRAASPDRRSAGARAGGPLPGVTALWRRSQAAAGGTGLCAEAFFSCHDPGRSFLALSARPPGTERVPGVAGMLTATSIAERRRSSPRASSSPLSLPCAWGAAHDTKCAADTPSPDVPSLTGVRDTGRGRSTPDRIDARARWQLARLATMRCFPVATEWAARAVCQPTLESMRRENDSGAA